MSWVLTLLLGKSVDGTKKVGCVANVGTRGGAKIGVSFLGAAPEGLKTSTYDFLSAL